MVIGSVAWEVAVTESVGVGRQPGMNCGGSIASWTKIGGGLDTLLFCKTAIPIILCFPFVEHWIDMN